MTLVAYFCILPIYWRPRVIFKFTDIPSCILSDFGLESQTAQILRMRVVCERIKHGYYPSVGRVESPNKRRWRPPSRKGSQLKALVDHYHKMLFCDIGKTGTSSWHAVFNKMVERDRKKRTEWFKKHPFRPYSIHKPDRYR